MSKAAELAALIGSQTALSNRNLIINGAMQVAQRGTSTTGVTSTTTYGADRFALQLNSIGTYTLSQSSTAPDGFSNSFKIDCTTADASPAAGDYSILTHKVEAQNLQHLGYGTSSAKAITLSFYLRSNKTGSIGLVIRQIDNSNKMFSKEVTINAADTWERKTVSIPADTSGVINDDNGTGLDISWWLNAGSTYSGGSEMTTWGTETNANKYLGDLDIGALTTDEFYITGVQLEVGEQATPFEHRSIGDELARCKRYFQRHDNDNSAYRWFGSGYTTSTTAASIGVALNPPMRAIPSFSLNVGASNFIFDQSGGAKACSAITSSFSSNTMARLFLTIGTTTASTPGWLASDGTSSLRALDFDAEL